MTAAQTPQPSDEELMQAAVEMMDISRTQLGWGMSDAEIALRARLSRTSVPAGAGGDVLTEDAITKIVQQVVSSSERPIGMVAYGVLVAHAIQKILSGKIVAAREWIVNSPHGDNCYLHDDGGEFDTCRCGKDSIIAFLESDAGEAAQAGGVLRLDDLPQYSREMRGGQHGRIGYEYFYAADDVKSLLASGAAQVPEEPTGEMWSAGRAAFIRYAQQWDDMKTSEGASVVCDIAPSAIYRDMLAAAPLPPEKQGE